MSARILTRTKFKAWLESKPKRSVVGRRNDPFSCPIANHMKYSGYAKPCVSGFKLQWSIEDRRTAANTPLWARAFINSVDCITTGNITAARALEILEGCK